MQPFVAELSSRENTQTRRVNLMASSRDEAAAIVERMDAADVAFRLGDDEYERAAECGLYVPKDTDMDGRFIRAGKTVRLRDEQPTRRPLAERGRVRGTEVLPLAAGNRGSSRLRSSLARHHQEQPYRLDRVGSTLPQNVLASMFGLGWQKQLEGSTGRFVWASDTIKVSLHTSTYTPNVDTHDFWNDAVNEVTGTGYTTGGATLASKTSTYDTASDQVRLDAADTSWATSTITARHAIIWYDTAGASSTDPLLGWVNFESDVSTTAGTFSITWDATGIFVFDLT